MATSPTDNYINKVSRIYVEHKSFKSPDNGQVIDYDRLILVVSVNGEDFPIELKADRRDLSILAIAEDLDGSAL